MNCIDEKVNMLVKKHQTRNPFVIAKNEGIKVIFEDLGENIFGYYNKAMRIKMIHINSRLNEQEQLHACGHELGHCILHSADNTHMLSKASINSELKVEREANEFNLYLTIDGSHEEFRITCKYDILNYYGLPEHMSRFIKDI